jgi:hypothetical protein
VRLAGVYAMARLADGWPEERQTCVNGRASGKFGTRLSGSAASTFHEPDAATSWCGLNLGTPMRPGSSANPATTIRTRDLRHRDLSMAVRSVHLGKLIGVEEVLGLNRSRIIEHFVDATEYVGQ